MEANKDNNGQCMDCTAGHYCPALTKKPLPCPPGTYSSSTGNDAIADC